MGNKCKFCITGYAGNRYVANTLMGQCGCGKCDGVITGLEKKIMINHYTKLKTELEQRKKYLEELQADIDDKLVWLRDYVPVREG